MIHANYRRNKAPRFYEAATGRRHVVLRYIAQDGADFYVESPKHHTLDVPQREGRHVFTSAIKVTDYDVMAAGKARNEFKKFALKRGWTVKFLKAGE